VPPLTAEERAAEDARGDAKEDDADAGLRGGGDAARNDAYEARLAVALIAAANAIEATPLAHALRGDEGGAAAARLRAVVLPPGAEVAGGDGDEALRWVPPA
jgi:hypothetical protein